jgi:hypothetical protein
MRGLRVTASIARGSSTQRLDTDAACYSAHPSKLSTSGKSPHLVAPDMQLSHRDLQKSQAHTPPLHLYAQH